MPLHGSPRERRREREEIEIERQNRHSKARYAAGGRFLRRGRAAPGGTWLERLLVIAAAIPLGRGNVAILDIVVLDRRRRLLFRFGVWLARELALLPGSAHDIPLMRTDRRLARHWIQGRRSQSSPSSGILAAVDDLSCLFCAFSVKRGATAAC